MLTFLGAGFLGWSLGANDAANVFGTAVSSRMVSWRRAAVLTAFFVLLGASLQGLGGVHTLSRLGSDDVFVSGVSALAAALTVTLMTFLKIPVSASQAVVGTLIGAGIAKGQVSTEGLGKVVLCWVGTPFGAMLFSVVFYRMGQWFFRLAKLNLFVRDRLLSVALVLTGCYGAYALGANNVANVASFFAVRPDVSPRLSVCLGGGAIALGVLTFSKGVMTTVGRGITRLDGFTALVVVLSQAVTVHVYAMLGVPVSTSQAIVGAVLGLGIAKGAHIINYRLLRRILCGWVSTPFVAAAVSWGLVRLAHSG